MSFFLKDSNVSSNMNEVTKAILDFFIQKLHARKKARNTYSEQKLKMCIKNI